MSARVNSGLRTRFYPDNTPKDGFRTLSQTILYARVSATEQTAAHQRTQAEQAGFRIDHVVADEGVSGITTRLADRVRILDTDMQGTLRDWGEDRSDPEGTNRLEPQVVVELSPNAKHLQAQVDRLRRLGVDLLIVGTPGGLQTPVPLIAAGFSDLVLVPIRPTNEDLNAFWPLVPRLNGSKVSMVALLSQCPTTTTRPRLDTQAILEAEGIRVAPVAVHSRGIVPASGVGGLTAMEVDAVSEADRRAVQEFRDLGAWVRSELRIGE